MKNILFVAGNFDLQGGRPSGLAAKMASYMDNVDLYNGGHYNQLEPLLNTVDMYDIVFWFANVPNELPKIRQVKEYNPKAILISSKRNDEKYEFKELVRRAINGKANLLFEFSKRESVYNIRVIDALGNVWYDGTDIELAVVRAMERIEMLFCITRESSKADKYRGHDIIEEDVTEFLDMVNKYSDSFYRMLHEENTENPFRCMRGMPSIRKDGKIFVSSRVIEGRHIDVSDLVEVRNDGMVVYCGDKKPAVDTPVHLKLYEELPNINYILHSHCYIDGAEFTKNPYPCGALQEADEILSLIEYKGTEYVAINEIGHGSILMAKDLDRFKAVYHARPLPENMEKEGEKL